MHPVQSAEAIVETILPPRSRWRAVLRFAGWALVVVYFLFASIILALRYWVLPKIGEYKGGIERSVSTILGKSVTIGMIEAGWQGLRPELFLRDVTIHDRDGRAALALPGVEAIFSWTSVVVGSPRFYSLAFDRPRLEIRRDKSGELFVAGMELQTAQAGDPRAAQWLLAQRELAIRDAAVTWIDEQRGAPALALTEVNMVLRDGFTHRFALRAKAPPELASMLDVRGELRGGTFGGRNARLFAALDYTDLAAWQQWFDYPFVLQSGKGAVRLWLEFSDKTLIDATADVALSQVSTRLRKDLPLFELESLQGRLGGGQREDQGFEIFGSRITLTTGTGVTLPPADFRVRWQPAATGAPPKGEFEIDTLALAPLAQLAEYLPFPKAVRVRLAATEPRGSVENLTGSWSGEPGGQLRYRARGNFSGLAARASGAVPGFSGLTGRVETSEKGGTLVLASREVAIELPGALPESPVQLDSLSGRINWTFAADHLEVGIGNLQVANRDLAGTFSGSYASRAEGPGFLDLTGTLNRADGRAAYRYIPFLPAAVTEYLKTSIRDGKSNDVRLRFRGDLAKFPFADSTSGIFRIVAKVNDAEFRFAENWPAASGVSGDLIFEGKSMRVAAPKAGILNLQASSLGVFVPDLFNGDEHVQVDIRSEDQTADFLNFIAKTPVTKALDGITDGMRAGGVGRLALQIDIPIRRPERFKLTGDYRVVNNDLWVDSDAPPFSKLNGRFEFTQSAMTARGLTSSFLGGPATISVTTQDGTIKVNAQGTADVAQIPRTLGESLLRQIAGSAAWQGNLTMAPKQPVSLVVQSRLTGVSSSLPAPLAKKAGEPLPLRIERLVAADPPGDRFEISLGPSVNAEFERRREGTKYLLRRGVIVLNEPLVPPDRDGISLVGNLPYVDVDRWRELFGSVGETGSSLSSSLRLRVGTLDFGGRRLNDVDLRAGTSGDDWIANVSAKELAGEIKWQPEGSGRIIARLKSFSMPEARPGKEPEPPTRELPALDIIADRLLLNGNDLGRLELVAVNKAHDWQIEKLALTGPESSLSVKKGVWQNWAVQPSVSLEGIDLKVSDVGKFLERVGFPRTVRSGLATLKGSLSWDGSPQSIDYASLSGNLELNAQKGQFLKADPGAAKLIGILSMQSWVTLDFRELFNKGFAFDSVSCSAHIVEGVLKTDDFRMKGPSAAVSMSGQTDLSRETQDLYARVEPAVGDSLSVVLAAVINPVWGLGALILQKILKNPLAQAFAFEYHVTGSWTDPKPEPLKLEVQTSDAQDRP